MALYLGILLFSFLITSIAIIPFIDILYRLKLTYTKTPTAPHHHYKVGTPIGGGVLIILLVTVMYAVLMPILVRLGVYITTVYPMKEELNIIFFTFISFGLLGLYDDLIKIFSLKQINAPGFKFGVKAILQVGLSVLISVMLYQNLKIDIINIPYIGVLDLGFWYIPLSSFIIFSFTRGFDITDGFDGLACGTLLICLLALWAVSVFTLDTTLSVFLALWLGSLIAFLYFNVFPARIWLGNVGSLSFGASLAVTGLLLGKTVALLVIGGVYILEGLSNFLQIASIVLRKKKLFPIAPLHYWLEYLGWPEPKIVMRTWLIGAMMAILGLWLAGV